MGASISLVVPGGLPELQLDPCILSSPSFEAGEQSCHIRTQLFLNVRRQSGDLTSPVKEKEVPLRALSCARSVGG